MNDGHTAPDGRDLKTLVRVFARRAPLIALCVVCGLTASLAVALHQPKEYTASASLLFRDSDVDQQLFGTQVIRPTLDPNREGATNLRLVTLQTVSTLTARRLRLDSEAVDVTVEGDGRSDLVDVNAVDQSPEQAANVANGFAEEFIAFRRRADQSKIDAAQRLVENQLKSMTEDQRDGERGQSLRERSEQLKILAALQTGNAELVQRASIPTAASAPRPRRAGALGALFGLLLGIAAALLLERLDNRFTDLEEFERIYKLPIIGVVPEARHAGSESVAEAFRMLRARLRYFNVDRDIRTVLVTSAAPEDGKSTVTWGLASAAAMSGAKVLLLEADLRRPVMARRHDGLVPVPGLSELLTHHVPLSDVVQEVPARGEGQIGDATIDVITAGVTPPSPAELIESHKMSSLLEELRQEYDLVVIDTPPTSAVSDPMPLVRQVDGVVVVSRFGRSRRDAARQLRQELESLGAPLLGVAVNGYRDRLADGYYGYSAYTQPQQPQPPQERELVGVGATTSLEDTSDTTNANDAGASRRSEGRFSLRSRRKK